VHVHEIAHTFVGVHHSDLEDPWWKEGLTNYLGNLLALQAGLIGDTVFANEMLTVRDTFPAVERYALSSPFVRSHLFPVMDSAFVEPPVPENYIALVYGKGGQASMILDRYILEHSGGKRSVFDLVRDVVASYGPAFRRADLVASVDRLTGGSSAAFLSSLLDHPDPLGQDSLVHTYAVLRALGRFAPGGGKSPIQNVDPPGEPNPAGKRSGTPGPAPSRQVTAVPAGSKL
jgi:predicted metalloprotease with PDZ domain